MKDNRIFDAEIRSMLESAEVKAPRRIWRNVSSSLDQERNRTAIYALAGLAFAAIAAALLIPGLLPKFSEPSGLVAVSAKPEEAAKVPAEDALVAVETVAPSYETEPVARLPKGASAVKANAGAGKEDAAAGKENASVGKEDAAVVFVSEDRQDLLPKEKTAKAEERPERFQPGAAFEPEHPAAVSKPRLIAGGTLSGGHSGGFNASQKAGGTPGISNQDVYTETGVSTYGLPFTVGLGIDIPLGKNFSIITGLDYSILTRSFDCSYTPAMTTVAVQGRGLSTLHYIGIPIKVGYTLLSTNSINLFAHAGGEAEFCVADRFTFTGAAVSKTEKSSHMAPQFSIGAGLGLEFKLSNLIGLYLDPEVNYYIPGNHPKSIRTDKALMLKFGAGLRFTLK